MDNFKVYENDKSKSFCVLNYDFFDKNFSLNDKFDVVFIDPPYELVKPGEVFIRLKELRVTKTNSLIIYESNKKLEKVNGFQIQKSRKIGKTYLSFLKFENQ